MIRRVCKVAIVAAGLALHGLALADDVDPLRCETIGLRKQAQLYECLARCERRNGWHVLRLGAAAEARLLECRADCEQRYVAAMEHMMTMDFCSGYGGGTCVEDEPSD